MPVPTAVMIAWISLFSRILAEPRSLDVEDLAAQRKDRLELAATGLLRGAAGGVTLDDEQLGLGRIARLTVGELAGQRRGSRGATCDERDRGALRASRRARMRGRSPCCRSRGPRSGALR